jgi:hypothetical protein
MSLFICVSSHTGHDDNPAVHDLFDDNGVHNGTVFDDKNSTSNPFVSSELNNAFSGTLALLCLFMVFM